MFEKELENVIKDNIGQSLWAIGVEPPENLPLRHVPFDNDWGVSTSVAFQLANGEYKLGKISKEGVAGRASEIANELAEALIEIGEFEKVEEVNGYVNIYIDLSTFSNRVVSNILSRASDYGKSVAKNERVMIEYSQPNTHKAFHVGHLRNVCLGASLLNIMEFAGFNTIGANYIGDIGLHVIKCLWAYLKYFDSQEPDTGKGQWLGEVYAEADDRLEFRNAVLYFIRNLVSLDAAFAKKLSIFFQDTLQNGNLSDIDEELLLSSLYQDWSKFIENFSEKINLESETIESGLESFKRSEIAEKNPAFFERLMNLVTGHNKCEAIELFGQLTKTDAQLKVVDEHITQIWEYVNTFLKTISKSESQDPKSKWHKLLNEYNNLNSHF